MFLYNLNSGSLMGLFRASLKPMIHKDPYAFMGSGTFPAQVEITWTKVRVIRDASKMLPFLKLDKVQAHPQGDHTYVPGPPRSPLPAPDQVPVIGNF